MAFETELDNLLTKADSLSGTVASTINSLPELSNNLKLKYSLFPEVLGIQEKIKVENLKSNENIMLSVNTTTTVGMIRKIKENEVEFSLRIPIVPLKGDSIGIARNISGHWRLIGFGEIL